MKNFNPNIPPIIILILGFIVLMICFFSINNMFVFGIIFFVVGGIMLSFYKKNLVKSLYEELNDLKYVKLANFETKIIVRGTLSYLQDTVTSDVIITEDNIFIIPLSSVVNKVFLMQLMKNGNGKRYAATKYQAYSITDKKNIESKIQFSCVKMTGLRKTLALTLDFINKPDEFKIINEFDYLLT